MSRGVVRGLESGRQALFFRRGCNRCCNPRSRGIPRWSEIGHKFHPCPFWSDFEMNHLMVQCCHWWILSLFPAPRIRLGLLSYRPCLCLLPVQAVWFLQFAVRMNVNILLPNIAIWKPVCNWHCYKMGIRLCQMTKAESSELFVVFPFETAFRLMD